MEKYRAIIVGIKRQRKKKKNKPGAFIRNNLFIAKKIL